MSSEAQRFARLVLEAFEAEGLTTDELVRQAGGPSNTYMTGLRKAAEGAELTEPRSDTYRRIERAAGWDLNTAWQVWRGGEPVQAADRRLAQMLGKPGVRSRLYSGGIEGYAERIADKLVDLEERVDFLEQRLEQLARGNEASDPGYTFDAAATTEGREDSGEFNDGEHITD